MLFYCCFIVSFQPCTHFQMHSLHPAFHGNNIPLYKGVFKSFPEKNDVFLEFFNIFHVISMILNEHDLLLHDISQLYLLCWLISIEISSILFIAYIHFPGKISSILFRWVIYLYIKVLFKSLLEKNDVCSLNNLNSARICNIHFLAERSSIFVFHLFTGFLKKCI